MSNYRLSELLDLTSIQNMADAHYRAAGMPVGIIDAIDGSILVGSGWQDICVKFHRANPDSLQRCRESDDYIKGHLVEGEDCHYKCKNGLWDIGIPIVVSGRHLATMFLGQFFYEGETPDRDFFIQLAHKFGFDVDEYLAALDRVPVFSREKVDYILEYDKTLVSFIADLAKHALLKIESDKVIQENERKFHAIFDKTYQFLGLLSIDGSLLEANKTALRFCGVEEADVIGKPFWEAPWWTHSPELQEKVRQAVQQAAKGEFIRFEATHPDADGDLHYVDFSLKPVTDEEGKVVLLIPEGRDISERKRAEEELKNQMEFVTTLLNTIPSPVFYKDVSGRYLGCNPAFEDFWGRSRENIIGQNVYATGPAEIAEKYEAMDNELFEQGGRQTYEWKVRDADGYEKDVIFNKATFSDAGGKTAGLVGVILDITERKRMERSLAENEARLRTLLQTIPDLIWLKDAEGVYLACNTMFERFFGAKEVDIVGKTDYDFLEKDLADFFREHDRKAVAAGKPTSNEEWITFADDGHRALLDTIKTPMFDVEGKLVGVLGIARDITERKRAEEEKAKLEGQLQQAQKMESVGRLAGGVAHDFNNMLSVIIGHAELSLGRVEPADPLFSALQEILKAAKRSADLTQQLLAFARKQTVVPKVIDLNVTVESILRMLRRLIGEDIDLAWLPGAVVWAIKVDPSQIDQILANLCVNARDAIAGQGRVTIETDNTTFDEAYCAEHPESVSGDFVMLAVSDDGHGMDKETRDKIFEPFFTTKGIGRGTGLGLATVYGIVKQNKGFINVYSEPGHGTTFKIYLPRYTAKTEQVQKKSPTVPVARGRETILLVEDESAILNLTKLVLESLGYRVLAALTPREAIQMVKEHVGEIHLLVADVVMPEMNGRDLARNLISLYPGLRQLFMSGYTANVIAHHGVLDEGINFIQKPFSIQVLAAKVREAIDNQ